jgi:hypothetical protein
MLRRKSNWTYLILALSMSISAHAFDLEDYATTYRATRDSYLKAANELKLATGPYKSARDSYVQATGSYVDSLKTRHEAEASLHSNKAFRKCMDASPVEKIEATPET